MRGAGAAAGAGFGGVVAAEAVAVAGRAAAGLAVVEDEGAIGCHGRLRAKKKDRRGGPFFLSLLYKFRIPNPASNQAKLFGGYWLISRVL